MPYAALAAAASAWLPLPLLVLVPACASGMSAAAAVAAVPCCISALTMAAQRHPTCSVTSQRAPLVRAGPSLLLGELDRHAPVHHTLPLPRSSPTP